MRSEFVRRHLLPVNEAAAAMGVSRGRLRRMIKHREVPFVLFPWRDTQVMGVPWSAIRRHS